ncbi:type I restriction endonuclease subunit R [Methanocrinis sp.]|uniref:type I restriction endonuclease subunit R n=1 Tax=Methanocrinis sp. TaxID=3101522 RepID=UPI003D0A4826
MSDQKELIEVEDPAVSVLTEHLGWTEIAAADAKLMKDSLRQPILVSLFLEAVKRINPWITEENAQRVVQSVVQLQATSVLEANEKIQTMLELSTVVLQDMNDGMGQKSQDVFFIDYQHPENNSFSVVRQFQVKHYRERIPDIVLFINGLPIVVIECKSPDLQNPMGDGIDQIFRYQEMKDEYKNLGIPQLFNTVQIVASTHRDRMQYATNYTPRRHWSEWRDPYPLTVAEVEERLGRTATPQDLFLFGVCSKENLLDLIQNFIVYEREGGKVVKKLAKYLQFRTVNKIIEKVTAEEREGGVVWHWMGSGKSLSMLWTAVKLRRLLENPTILVVTDRTDLDSQIHGTFKRCGFSTPIKAESAKKLQEHLTENAGKTVMTTLQKFQDAADVYPTLSEDEKIFVLVDEAHRSQYRTLAGNMRKALPNACFLAFTGTPIFKKDRDTFNTFGPYIDRYDHNQSVKEGITVPIFYEGRMPELQITGKSIDQLLRRIFPDETDEVLELINKKYATLDTIAESRPLIKEIALNIIDHYEKHILPDGFKAQIVATSRLAAIRYKEILDELNAPSSEVLISVGHDDGNLYQPFRRSKTEEEDLKERFKKEKDPKILIVCDMLLAGFDAPVEQVMYLHKPLKEHNLLQAMGRVNRKSSKKEYGLVVDYWGVADELQKTLRMYSEDGIENLVHTDYRKEVLPRLQAAHSAAINFFREVPPQKDRESYNEACVQYLEPEDRRVALDQRFKLFARYMDMLLPDPRALKYVRDLKWLGYIRARVRNRYRDGAPLPDDCSDKVRKLIEDYLKVEGINQILEQISIHSEEFDEEVSKLISPEAKASEIEHAIKHEINIKLDENPVFYESLRERLERIIEDYRQRRIDEAERLRALQEILEEARSPEKHAERLGVDPEVAPFYELILAKSDAEADHLKPAAQKIHSALKERAVVDWQQKEDTKRDMRRKIKRILREVGYPPEEIQDTTVRIMDLAARRFAG